MFDFQVDELIEHMRLAMATSSCKAEIERILADVKQVDYHPKLAAALDAIKDDDIDVYKQAMETIHECEQVWPDGVVAAEARMKFGLKLQGAVLPESLTRRGLIGKVGDTIKEIAQRNRPDWPHDGNCLKIQVPVPTAPCTYIRE